jgi:hypothetical protein
MLIRDVDAHTVLVLDQTLTVGPFNLATTGPIDVSMYKEFRVLQVLQFGSIAYAAFVRTVTPVGIPVSGDLNASAAGFGTDVFQLLPAIQVVVDNPANQGTSVRILVYGRAN